MRIVAAVHDPPVWTLPTSEVRRMAAAAGMLTLLEDGLDKVVQGVTSLDEVLRVAGTGEGT